MKLSLDRTPMDASEILLTGIPMPPSANNAFLNVPGRGRVKTKRYRTWANAAGWEVRRQRPQRVRGAVNLTYTIEEAATKADIGNLEKGLTDLLVDLGLIEGDGPSVVRSIKLQWGSAPGVTIEVRAA